MHERKYSLLGIAIVLEREKKSFVREKSRPPTNYIISENKSNWTRPSSNWKGAVNWKSDSMKNKIMK